MSGKSDFSKLTTYLTQEAIKEKEKEKLTFKDFDKLQQTIGFNFAEANESVENILKKMIFNVDDQENAFVATATQTFERDQIDSDKFPMLISAAQLTEVDLKGDLMFGDEEKKLKERALVAEAFLDAAKGLGAEAY